MEIPSYVRFYKNLWKKLGIVFKFELGIFMRKKVFLHQNFSIWLFVKCFVNFYLILFKPHWQMQVNSGNTGSTWLLLLKKSIAPPELLERKVGARGNRAMVRILCRLNSSAQVLNSSVQPESSALVGLAAMTFRTYELRLHQWKFILIFQISS